MPGLAERFPTIVARCREAGIDPVTELVPVTPAAHYASGGLATDLSGRTTVPGLYACGEVACTGVHGANRLASNSLLEGLVFAGRIGEALARELPVPAAGEPADARPEGLVDAAARADAHRHDVRPGGGAAQRHRAGRGRRAGWPRWGSGPPPSPGCRAGRPPTCSPWRPRSPPRRPRARRPAAATGGRTTPRPADDWRVHLDVRLDADGEVALTRRPVGDARSGRLAERSRATVTDDP